MVIAYPIIFLCGATIPLEMLPSSVQQIAAFLPLTYVVRLMRGLWVGEPWSDLWLEVAVLTAVLVVCGLVSARLLPLGVRGSRRRRASPPWPAGGRFVPRDLSTVAVGRDALVAPVSESRVHLLHGLLLLHLPEARAHA